MRDLLEIGLTSLTILALIVGAIRWLLAVYYTQQRTLSALEQGHMDVALSTLKQTVEAHARELKSHNELLRDVDKDLKYTNKYLIEVKDELKDSTRSTDSYTRGVEQRLSKLEVISENLRIVRTPK